MVGSLSLPAIHQKIKKRPQQSTVPLSKFPRHTPRAGKGRKRHYWIIPVCYQVSYFPLPLCFPPPPATSRNRIEKRGNKKRVRFPLDLRGVLRTGTGPTSSSGNNETNGTRRKRLKKITSPNHGGNRAARDPQQSKASPSSSLSECAVLFFSCPCANVNSGSAVVYRTMGQGRRGPHHLVERPAP